MKAPQKAGGRLTIGKGVGLSDYNPNHDKRGLFAASPAGQALTKAVNAGLKEHGPIVGIEQGTPEATEYFNKNPDAAGRKEHEAALASAKKARVSEPERAPDLERAINGSPKEPESKMVSGNSKEFKQARREGMKRMKAQEKSLSFAAKLQKKIDKLNKREDGPGRYSKSKSK